jgi:hypothetical protein
MQKDHNINIKIRPEGYHSRGSGWGPMARSSEYGNEPSKN